MITISNEYITAKIAPLGAELKSLYFNDTEYTYEGRPEVWNGSAPGLFPFCGGLKDGRFTHNGKEYEIAKHGYARRTLFEVEAVTETKAVFLHKSNEETKKCFPFDYELRVIFTLEGKTLEIDYNVKNTGAGEMYFGIGSHEAYYTPEGIEDYDVIFDEPQTLDATQVFGSYLGDAKLPIIKDCTVLPLYEKYFVIDALVFEDIEFKAATLKNRKTGRKLRVEFPDAKYFLLWHKPNSPFICLEPWRGHPDYITTESYELSEKKDIITLPEKESYNYHHNITLY